MTDLTEKEEIGRKVHLSDISPRLKWFFKHGVKRAFVKHPFALGFGASLVLLQAAGFDAASLSGVILAAVGGNAISTSSLMFMGIHFKRRINDLKAENKPEEAALAVKNVVALSGVEIEKMPPTQLYKYLCAGFYEGRGDEKTHIDRLLKYGKLDGRFLADEGQRVKNFFDWFSNSKAMEKGNHNWQKRSKFERLEILQEIADQYCKVLGHKSIPIYGFRKSMTKKGGITCANFNQKVVEVGINTHKDGLWDDFAHTASSVIHELTHYGQYCLAKNMRSGTLKESDPRYNQARIFEFNFLKYRHDDFVYREQPLEEHAYMRQKEAMIRVYIHQQAGPVSKLDDLFKHIKTVSNPSSSSKKP